MKGASDGLRHDHDFLVQVRAIEDPQAVEGPSEREHAAVVPLVLGLDLLELRTGFEHRDPFLAGTDDLDPMGMAFEHQEAIVFGHTGMLGAGVAAAR